jgi:hypothetical protein
VLVGGERKVGGVTAVRCSRNADAVSSGRPLSLRKDGRRKGGGDWLGGCGMLTRLAKIGKRPGILTLDGQRGSTEVGDRLQGSRWKASSGQQRTTADGLTS